MQVLLVGGTGFVGTRVHRLLAHRGHNTTVASRQPSAVHGLETIQLNLADPQSIEQLDLTGYDAVCNLGARTQAEGDVEPDWYFEVNAFGAERLARRAAGGAGPSFMHVSTGNAYALDETRPTEQSPLYPTGPAHRYLSSKVAGEILVGGIGQQTGMPVAVIRPSTIYGPRMGPSVVTSFVDRATRGAPLTVSNGGHHQADFVHVDDVARCVVDALERGDSGAFNVGSGAATTILELAQLIINIFDSPSEIHVEESDLKESSGFPPLDITRARQAWEFAPRSLREGLLSMHAWQGDNGC